MTLQGVCCQTIFGNLLRYLLHFVLRISLIAQNTKRRRRRRRRRGRNTRWSRRMKRRKKRRRRKRKMRRRSRSRKRRRRSSSSLLTFCSQSWIGTIKKQKLIICKLHK